MSVNHYSGHLNITEIAQQQFNLPKESFFETKHAKTGGGIQAHPDVISDIGRWGTLKVNGKSISVEAEGGGNDETQTIKKTTSVFDQMVPLLGGSAEATMCACTLLEQGTTKDTYEKVKEKKGIKNGTDEEARATINRQTTNTISSANGKMTIKREVLTEIQKENDVGDAVTEGFFKVQMVFDGKIEDFESSAASKLKCTAMYTKTFTTRPEAERASYSDSLSDFLHRAFWS